MTLAQPFKAGIKMDSYADVASATYESGSIVANATEDQPA
jgi:hypothetical protein